MLERVVKASLARPAASLYGLHTGFSIPALDHSQLRHATTSSLPNSSAASKRKAVTVINDTGRVPWENLSTGEKAARATQQTFNFGLVALGVVLTGGIATVLYLEVFSPDSKTAYFNSAADRVRSDPKCRELLAGEGSHSKREISAYGEPSWSRWARNRTIASRFETDRAGVEHLHMHFYVEGPVAKGTVNLHMTRKDGGDFQYEMLALDVPGQQRYYLEDANSWKLGKQKAGKMFGVNWNR
ncbi:Mitochondrial import inner membrane translocase subunit tim21 [Fulvia fulva]|uniref:Mitochondrial import inner membrane translocase subunit Tim21 n=1 Tax=Passalora fulva TaxID=5499 RepID=A0A9Q8LDG3_PASFU|nr:Mitochondrial import inner membrane translocase subunit tim21 [Fulvia fulva]KAK4628985.1 Mitochondrial import inner membrane translocase subunit tim21 [Fulvia fulva]KAK4629834.1 Mitochondrial import inner membrane translocase subunit tim21 [Fulvia fulva]UJO15355.1 Mitochondrial import inner membrane translocase subunit tim21 [Fulvia fulva]WPV12997.1 Mitochondrial import inner membrane translocase subunit tim21 [Fulvia fulva]WPV27054.1 Mitochondrial import inner membrane translocase subunit 